MRFSNEKRNWEARKDILQGMKMVYGLHGKEIRLQEARVQGSSSRVEKNLPKFSGIERGARLTPERLEKLIVGQGLTKEEKDVFFEVLFNRESATSI